MNLPPVPTALPPASPGSPSLDQSPGWSWAVGQKHSPGRGGVFQSPWREYGEALAVIGVVTVGALFTKLTHHAIGQIYLLAVILLCLRVGRGPVLTATVGSVVAWSYFFFPPRFSFQLVDYDDGILLGIYFAVALIAGQMIARIRAQEHAERRQQRQATALYQLARALASGRARDDALREALRQAEVLFGAPAALLLNGDGRLVVHPAGTRPLGEGDLATAAWVQEQGRPAGRFTDKFPRAAGLFVPVRRAGVTLGVLVFGLPPEAGPPTGDQQVLIETLVAQIALLVEREALRSAAEHEKLLMESDRLHRTLFDSVSHELKTPLAVLRVAGDQLDRADAAKRTQLTREIKTATRRLERLVANLLDQNRLESGLLRARTDWCEARDIIQAARHAVDESLLGRAVRVTLPEDMPLLRADAPLLEQVLVNLLLNACHHTPPGSPLDISAGQEDRAGEPWLFLRVTDHGPGLPEDWSSKLFRKFSRGAAAAPGGLGLGLSIVRGFMQAQGGDVTAANTSGGGASFTLYLPHMLHGNVPDDEN